MRQGLLSAGGSHHRPTRSIDYGAPGGGIEIVSCGPLNVSLLRRIDVAVWLHGLDAAAQRARRALRS